MTAPEVSAGVETKLEIGVKLEVDVVEVDEEFVGTVSVKEAVSAGVVDTGFTEDM